MLAFDSGFRTRPPKYGGYDNDPAWTPGETAAVRGHCAAIRTILSPLISEACLELHRAVMCNLAILARKNYREDDCANAQKWQLRAQGLLGIFSQMNTDLGTGGSTITFRKATDIPVAEQIAAVTEPGGIVQDTCVSVNANPADRLYFFAPANAATAQRTLFHELTHLYGTEDSGVPDINNAHKLEDLLLPGATPQQNLDRFLEKQRTFALLGDQPILGGVGGPITLDRLKLFYGADNAWDRQGFDQTFVPGPDDLVTRRSDRRSGTISVYRDAADRPLFYYNFK